jgi:prepilin-type processing-associated H-X9-DG protein
MTLEFRCECGQSLQAEDQYAGRMTRCPKCERQVAIPGIQPAPAPQPPPRPGPVTRRPRPDTRPPDEDDEDEEERRERRRSSGGSRAWIVVLVVAIVGGVGVLCLIPAILIGLMIPAVQKVREAAARIQDANNLKQLSLAVVAYSDDHGNQLPPAVVYDKDGQPLYSWRVLILPYLGPEEQQLYQQFHLDEPWDSPHNKPLLARMPQVFAEPGKPPAEPYATRYQVFDGPGAVFNSDKRGGLVPFDPTARGPFGPPPGQASKLGLQQAGTITRFPAGITDGTSNTILIVEAGDPVPWSKPADLHWDPNGPLPKLGGTRLGGFNAAMADGSVRFVQKSTSERTIRAAITANGGEVLGPDW